MPSLILISLLGLSALCIMVFEAHHLVQALRTGEILYGSEKFNIRITGFPALILHLFAFSSGLLAALLATSQYKKRKRNKE